MVKIIGFRFVEQEKDSHDTCGDQQIDDAQLPRRFEAYPRCHQVGGITADIPRSRCQQYACDHFAGDMLLQVNPQGSGLQQKDDADLRDSRQQHQ